MLKEVRELIESFIFVTLVGVGGLGLGVILGIGLHYDYFNNQVDRCLAENITLEHCIKVQGWKD